MAIQYTNNGNGTATLTLTYTASKTKLDGILEKAARLYYEGQGFTDWDSLGNQAKLNVFDAMIKADVSQRAKAQATEDLVKAARQTAVSTQGDYDL